MGIFDLIANTAEGIAEATVNVAKAGVGVAVAPIDGGKTIEEASNGVRDGVKKIGKADKK